VIVKYFENPKSGPYFWATFSTIKDIH
jgi:hypothetical protein